MLEDSDVNDLPDFLHKLRYPPFQIRLSTDKGSFARKVRRLCVKNSPEALSLPMANYGALSCVKNGDLSGFSELSDSCD